MKNRKTILIILIFAFLAAAPTWGQQGCQVTAYGIVTDTSGQPVAGAMVYADTSTTTTGEAGGYSISRIQYNCNSMYVRIEASGYVTQTQYTPGGDGSYNLDFVLESDTPTVCGRCDTTVNGYVYDVAGSPVAGITVYAVVAPAPVITDSDGYYSVDMTIFDAQNSTGTCPVSDDVVYAEGAGYRRSNFFIPLTCNAVLTSDLTIHKYGDANNDAVADIVDALLIARYYVGFSDTGFNIINSDVNSDSQVDILDALLVAQYYVGLVAELPA